MTRRRGFTLIELLVVIAIIGILASMVFPVFARARESARKAVCLSNVKNLALALQMYLTDNNDRFPPQNTQAGAEDMLVVAGMYGFGYVCDTQQDNMNPYLRWPVLLEEYTKNREVWACPSAIVESATGVIIPNTYTGGWLGWWEVAAGSGVGYPCDPAFPSGWGGEVTDSFAQQTDRSVMEGAKRFHQEIGANASLAGTGLVQLEDPVWTVAFADAGLWAPIGIDITYISLPNLCWWPYTPICYPDGPYYASFGNCGQWGVPEELYLTPGPDFKEQAIRRGTRHLGGSNIGWVDGHASWMHVRQIWAEAPHGATGWWDSNLVYGKIKGLKPGAMPHTLPDGTWPEGCGGSSPDVWY